MGTEVERKKRSATAMSPSAARLAEAANREHRKAVRDASNAVQHAVRAGEILARARDMCEAGEWGQLVAGHFEGSMRTAQKYMRLARHVNLLRSQGPIAALTSQNEAAKALTTIMRPDQPAPKNGGSVSKRRARGAAQKKAISYVEQALNLLARVERELNALDSPGYTTRNALRTVRDGRTEIERMLAELAGASAAEAPQDDAPLAAPEALNGGFDGVA